jgi:hypothetical protein
MQQHKQNGGQPHTYHFFCFALHYVHSWKQNVLDMIFTLKINQECVTSSKSRDRCDTELS